MTDGREVVEDYGSMRLSLRSHPVRVPLRGALDARKIVRCGDLARIKDGRRIEIAGIVLVRQRPGAGNVTFISIEDETGIANLIIWQRRFEAQRRIVMAARMVVARGILQREGEVIHLIAERLEDATPLLGTIGDMPFPHRHAPSDGASGSGQDSRDPHPLPAAAFGSDELKLKSRNFH